MPYTNRKNYMAFRRRLISGFCLLVALLILSFTWKIYTSYESDRETARSQTKNFVQAMSAHVVGALQVVDLSLASSADAIKTLDANAMLSPDAIKQLLLPPGRIADTSFWIIFIDTQGRGVAASNNLPINGVSYADRPYFSSHVQNAESGLFIGGPEIGRVSKRRIFFLSRRVTTAAGKFLGVVAAPVDASAFANVFSNALFQPALSITLAHTDGKIIARSPKFDESFGTSIVGSTFFKQMATAPSGTYEAKSLIDGDTRIYSYKTIENMPLVLSVGMARQAWAAGLIDDLLVATVGLVAIMAVLFFSGNFALHSYQRLARSEGDQRRLNAELQAAKEGLAAGEKRIRMITDNLPALIAYIDADGRYVFHNSFYRNIKGIDVDTMVGKTIREVYSEEDYALVQSEIEQAMTGRRVAFERSVTRDGVEGYFKFEYTPDFDTAGKVVGLYSMVTNVTGMKRVQNQLALLARIDTLTGLPNRSYLHDRLAEAIARSRRNGKTLACLFLDLDGFKQVNDTFGHAGGDALLTQFGARLQTCVRQTDMVARLAGDEFVIVLEGLEQPDGAKCVAAKIVEAMQVPFHLTGTDRLITTSIGVAIADEKTDDPDSLLRKADEALYQAKHDGKNLYTVYKAPVVLVT